MTKSNRLVFIKTELDFVAASGEIEIKGKRKTKELTSVSCHSNDARLITSCNSLIFHILILFAVII